MKNVMILMVFLLVGCAVNPTSMVNYSDSQTVASLVTSDTDDYKKITIFRAPNIAKLPETIEYKANQYLQGDSPENSKVYLRAIRSTEGKQLTVYQLYISSNYLASRNSWKFYNEAIDSNGKKLKMNIIDRKVGDCGQYGCSLEETLGITMLKQDLEEYALTGLKVKLYSKNGSSQIYYIPGGYISGFLDYLN